MSSPAQPRRGRRTREDDGPRASFRQLLPYLAEHKGKLAAVAIISIVAAAASLAQPLLVGQVITAVQENRPLGLLLWLLIAFVVLASLLSGYQHYLLQHTGTAVVLSSRLRLISRILHLPIREFDARRTGDLVSRVGTDTTLLYAVLTRGLADSVGSSVIFVGALIAMLVIDPVLLLLIVAVIVLSALVVLAFAARIRTASAAQQEKIGELSSGMERAITSIRTIRAAGATGREENAITQLARSAFARGLDVAKASAIVVPLAQVALQISILVVLGVGGFRVAAGSLSVASLVTFVMFLFLLVMPLGNAIGAVTSVSEALGALGRIEEITRLPREDDEDAAPATALAESLPNAPEISLYKVTFRYPEAVVKAHGTAAEEARSALQTAKLGAAAEESSVREDVLRGISFSVPRGARVALVGPSGAGKSTVLSLVERFYDPTGGVIRLRGHDIRTYSRSELRAHFGYVEQDAPTLAGTLADNLRLASPDATDEECERVLRLVNLGGVLDRSPLGLETAVGESGVMLSGGERQRLAVARALLTDAPILLLDESTSSLDGLNEQLMRQAIEAAAAERTLIVVAHRLSTVVDSDLIIVLNEGRVIGQGTHDELLTQTPLYRDLARHQLLV